MIIKQLLAFSADDICALNHYSFIHFISITISIVLYINCECRTSYSTVSVKPAGSWTEGPKRYSYFYRVENANMCYGVAWLHIVHVERLTVLEWKTFCEPTKSPFQCYCIETCRQTLLIYFTLNVFS